MTLRPLARIWIVSILLTALFTGTVAASPSILAPALTMASVPHFVSQVVMSPVSPNIIPDGQYVNFSFNYTTTYPAGVRIFTRPFSAGVLSPSYGANPSGVYPMGSGSATGFFTITSGEVVVDQVRIEIVAADTQAVLQDYFLPVFYQFSGAGDLPYYISLNPQTPNFLGIDQDVTINFQYRVSTPGGIRIFPRPMTGGSTTPSYAANPSGLYTGTGATSGYFRITSGTPTVDHIRFQLTDPSGTTVLSEFFLPVSYQVTNATTRVSDIVLSPPTANPNILDNGQDVNLTFNYTTDQPGGVRIFARPFFGNDLALNYAASGSILYPTGVGSGSGSFTIVGRTELVDGIRFQVTNANQTTVLFEKVIPVHYIFGGNIHFLFFPMIERGD